MANWPRDRTSILLPTTYLCDPGKLLNLSEGAFFSLTSKMEKQENLPHKLHYLALSPQ